MLSKILGAFRFALWTRLRHVSADGLGRLDRFPRLAQRSRGSVHLGRRVRMFPGVRIDITERDARLRIGARTYLNRNVQINCATSVSIGDDCAIAWDVLIMDNDAHSIDGHYGRRPISIGDHVWIGKGASILKGVTIGEGAIIGLGSVVTRDVPPHSMVAGQPARVIRENVSWGL